MKDRRMNGVNWRIRADVMDTVRRHTRETGVLQYRWVEDAIIQKLQREGVAIKEDNEGQN
jgi:hypothetical protein